RLAEPPGRRDGAAEGPARIPPEAAFPSQRRRSRRLRAGVMAENETAGVLPEVDIYTDGACSGNPGPGGWGAILRFGEVEKELAGGEPVTTNNRMELMAAIAGLEALKRPCRVRLYTDSQYLRDGITRWLPGWKARGWRTAAKA